MKTGSTVIIKDTDQKGKIERIENGRYYIDNVPYMASELKSLSVAPPKTNTKRLSIRKRSALGEVLDEIYKIVHAEFMALPGNQVCKAMLPGCRIKADQNHHMGGRANYFLIMSAYFMPICSSCHRIATDDSEEAIRQGISLPRNSSLPNSFTEREIELMNDFDVRIP